MDSDTKKSTSEKADDHMGITFNEIRSDEPHEEVSPKATEQKVKYSSARDSHLTNRDDVFNVSKAFESDRETGMIVSDRRRQRPSLKENLSSAFKEWWGRTSTSVSKKIEKTEGRLIRKEVEVPLIEKADTRKEVIEKAATYATFAPQGDDHHVVVEKIRTFKQDVAKATGNSPILVKEAVKKVPSWTHSVEGAQSGASTKVATPDLRASMVAPVVLNRVRKDEPTLENTLLAPPPRMERPMQLPPKITHVQVPNMVVKKDLSPKKAVEILPRVQTIMRKTAPPPASLPVSELPSEIPQVIKRPLEASVRTAVAPRPTIAPPPLPQMRSALPSIPPPPVKREPPRPSIPPAPKAMPQVVPPKPEPMPSGQGEIPSPMATDIKNAKIRLFIKWGILAGIVILGITLAVVASIYFNVFTKEEPVYSLTIPTFIHSDLQAPVRLQGSKKEFLTALHAQVTKAQPGVTQFYPTIVDEINEHPATSEEVFTFLNTNLSKKTIRAFDASFMMGSVTATKNNEPFLIIRSYNFDVLFAGLLSWEPTIYSDLSPFFGDAPLANTSFKDAVRGNASTRILYDGTGKEVLLYSFINQDTVVITTSGEALAKIITRF
jgi:hypothetical protein